MTEDIVAAVEPTDRPETLGVGRTFDDSSLARLCFRRSLRRLCFLALLRTYLFLFCLWGLLLARLELANSGTTLAGVLFKDGRSHLPTPGCWEITGRDENDELTFVRCMSCEGVSGPSSDCY